MLVAYRDAVLIARDVQVIYRSRQDSSATEIVAVLLGMGPLLGNIFEFLTRPNVARHIPVAVHFAEDIIRQARKDRAINARMKAEAAEFVARGRTLSVAVLGESEVGKTTLISSWRGVPMDSSLMRTQAPRDYGDITVTTSQGNRLTFREIVDVGGHTWNLPAWDSLVDEGRWVLYLVNAQRFGLASPVRESDRFRLEEDADRIFKIIRAREAASKIAEVGTVIVVTHADLDPRWHGDPIGYEQHLRQELDRVILLLGGDRRVRLVCGSLADRAGSDELTDRITEHLFRWQP